MVLLPKRATVGFRIGLWQRRIFRLFSPTIRKNFIEVDIKGARFWAGAKESLALGLKNVAFTTQIELIEDVFAEDEVDEIWIVPN